MTWCRRGELKGSVLGNEGERALNRNKTCFNFRVTTPANGNQVRQVIGEPVVLVFSPNVIELAERSNVVNVVRTAALLLSFAAHLTGVVVALAGKAALASPVRPVVVNLASSPIPVVSPGHTPTLGQPVSEAPVATEVVGVAVLPATADAPERLAAVVTRQRAITRPSRVGRADSMLAHPFAIAVVIAELAIGVAEAVGVAVDHLAAICAGHLRWRAAHPHRPARAGAKGVTVCSIARRTVKGLAALLAGHVGPLNPVGVIGAAPILTLPPAATGEVAEVPVVRLNLIRLALQRLTAMGAWNLNLRAVSFHRSLQRQTPRRAAQQCDPLRYARAFDSQYSGCFSVSNNSTGRMSIVAQVFAGGQG